MLTKKGLVQFLWLWMICGCSTSCGGKSADPNLTSIDSGASTFSVSSSIASGGSTYSVGGSIASGGSTYSVGGAATGACGDVHVAPFQYPLHSVPDYRFIIDHQNFAPFHSLPPLDDLYHIHADGTSNFDASDLYKKNIHHSCECVSVKSKRY